MSVGAESTPGERYCPTCERAFTTGERCPDDGTKLVKLAPGHDALIGRELDGRYTVEKRLGQGGMGTVYQGIQHSVGREVAIKVVTPSLVADPMVVKRFLREAKLASRLAHPNAVSVLDFGQTDDGLFYLIMELVAGRTLDDVLDDEGKLTPARVVRIGTQICDALEGAHALQIVHRDLKPQNVMLLSTGRDLVKVLDFGLAKSLSSDVGKSTMTNAGALLGTPAFMPPELVSGDPTDARADLYSLGCVLYLAVSGAPPFRGESVHELIAMHASEPVKPLRDVPEGLSYAIERLLAKHPDDRFQTAAAAREALEAAVSIVEVAEPTLVAGQATMLGWTNPEPSNPAAAPLPSSRVKVPTRAISDVETLVRPVSEHDVLPTVFAPEGIKPQLPATTAKRASSAIYVVIALVMLVAAATAAYFVIAR